MRQEWSVSDSCTEKNFYEKAKSEIRYPHFTTSLRTRSHDGAVFFLVSFCPFCPICVLCGSLLFLISLRRLGLLFSLCNLDGFTRDHSGGGASGRIHYGPAGSGRGLDGVARGGCA